MEVPNLNGKVKPNLTARLKLNDYTNANAILIPQSIISENAKGAQFIYIIKDKKSSNRGFKRLVIETAKHKEILLKLLITLQQEQK